MGKLRDWLSSNMLLRNMLADFGYRSAYTDEAGGFIPYFQYRIGPYHRDYYLHFPKEPFAVRYRNEVFNKLFEYEADDIYKYLEFHYQAFPEKNAFVLFLDRQLTERLKKPHSKQRRIKLESASDWVGEKRELLKQQSITTKEEIPVTFGGYWIAKLPAIRRKPAKIWTTLPPGLMQRWLTPSTDWKK